MVLLGCLLVLCRICVVFGATSRQVIIITGNFSLDGHIMNIAHYDVRSGLWSSGGVEALFLYGDDSNGVVWDVAVNKTDPLSNHIYLVGTFDTIAKSSQVQLCSVGTYDGHTVEKVGEGLCPRGGLSTMALRVKTSELGSNGDLFVGGDFKTRVWDGKHFTDVYYVSIFDGVSQSWLPLKGGKLNCTNEDLPRVNSLSWDAESATLFVGGLFNAIGSAPISAGLAMWTREAGLLSLPAVGVASLSGGTGNCWVQTVRYEAKSKTLFVAGHFDLIDGHPCPTVAAWHRTTNTWFCLSQASHHIATVTAMELSADGTMLYLAGWAAATSSWSSHQWRSPYAIAQLNISRYIAEHSELWLPHSERGSGDDGDDWVDSAEELRNTGEGTEGLQRRLVVGDDPHAEIAAREGRHRHNKQQQQRVARESSQRKAVSRRLETNSDNSTQQSSLSLTLSGALPRGSKPTPTPSVRPPTAPPTPIPPWTPVWEWLPGFTGGNGPIMHLTAGRDSLSACLFISGAFDNLPALLMWCRGDSSTASSSSSSKTKGKGANGKLYHRRSLRQVETSNVIGAVQRFGAVANRRLQQSASAANVTITDIGRGHKVFGLVTSISQAYITDEPPPQPLPPPVPPSSTAINYPVFVVSGSIILGVVIGAVFAVMSFFSKRLAGSGGGDKGVSAADDELVDVPQGGISLKMLSDSNTAGSSSVDFKECFERAMSARHLPSHDALVVVNPREIVLYDIIGEGSFGRVWSGQWRNNSVAVKEFVFAQAAIVGGSLQRHNIIEEIVGEAGIMACLRHPKILQLYGCSLTMQAIWIVSELCIRGSLRSVLVNRDAVDLPLIKKLGMCMDVADGMNYLHTRTPPIIHRDLKSHNVFVTEPSPGHYIAKIGDWGSARAVALSGVKSMTHGVGTACWLAPEVINNAHFSKASDVYAFGIVLWEVSTRQEVYEGLTAAQIIAKVAHEELRPYVPRDCPWSKVMTACWHQQVAARPDFHNILVTLSKIYAKLSAHPELANSKSGELRSEDFETLENAGGVPDKAPWIIREAEDAATAPLLEDYHDIVSTYQSANSNRPPAAAYTTTVRKSVGVGNHNYQPTRAVDSAFHPSLENIDPSVTTTATNPQPQQTTSNPKVRSRPIDYATDPHNFRPPRTVPMTHSSGGTTLSGHYVSSTAAERQPILSPNRLPISYTASSQPQPHTTSQVVKTPPPAFLVLDDDEVDCEGPLLGVRESQVNTPLFESHRAVQQRSRGDWE